MITRPEKAIKVSAPAHVVTLVDRLVHHADVIKLEGDSYRLKEAKERGAKGKKKPEEPTQ